MKIRCALLGLLVAFLLASGAGCHNPETETESAPVRQLGLSSNTLFRVQWVGRKRLGTMAGAYYLMRLWQLPEAKRLEAQTLDKLSFAPWRLLQGEPAVANAPSAMLRPLLEDIVQNACYCELRQSGNQGWELAFAIRLDDQRSGLWRTNLVAVIATLTGVQTMDLLDNGQGWSLRRQEAPNHFVLTRIGEWTALGIGQNTNTVFDQVVARIRRDHTPLVLPVTNCWLAVDGDLGHFSGALSPFWVPPAGLPKISFAVTGDGGNVLTHGTLTFPGSLKNALVPWTIPTNLVHEPLTSFTAVRGAEPWLKSWQKWGSLGIGQPPDEVYFWTRAGASYQNYFAAPLFEASNRVREVAQRLLKNANPWLASHGYVGFERLPEANGVAWGKLHNIRPFIESVDAESNAVIFGGLVPEIDSSTNNQASLFFHPTFAHLLQKVASITNLVRYHWELTGPQIDALQYVGEFLRVISHHTQLPLRSASMAWLSTLVPRGGNCETVVTLTRTNELTFSRRSMVGFTALELHLLADWLESPRFPAGLHTFLAKAAGAPIRDRPK